MRIISSLLIWLLVLYWLKRMDIYRGKKNEQARFNVFSAFVVPSLFIFMTIFYTFCCCCCYSSWTNISMFYRKANALLKTQSTSRFNLVVWPIKTLSFAQWMAAILYQTDTIQLTVDSEISFRTISCGFFFCYFASLLIRPNFSFPFWIVLFLSFYLSFST